MFRINRLTRLNVVRPVFKRNLSSGIPDDFISGPFTDHLFNPKTTFEKVHRFCTLSGACIGAGYGSKECIDDIHYAGITKSGEHLILSPIVIGIYSFVGAVVGFCAPVSVPIMLISVITN